MHHRFIFILSLFFLTWSCRQVSEQQTDRRPSPTASFQSVFDEYGLEGCFVLADKSGSIRTYHNQSRADTGFIPASTFKIPNSVIALAEGVVKDTAQVFPWDGKERAFASWNQDQTLVTAFRRSAAWVYSVFASQIETGTYQQYLNDFNYGNQDLSGPPTTFWLEGPFRISANQQVDFLHRFYHHDLGVDKEQIELVKYLMLLEEKEGVKWYGKTGAGKQENGQWILWLVGFVEKGDDVFFYALNFDTDDFTQYHRKRYDIVEKILQKEGIWP
ncbi:MAG: penicillin-binding transpeptidase domain-containing protein [Bacteroidota bacterium]